MTRETESATFEWLLSLSTQPAQPRPRHPRLPSTRRSNPYIPDTSQQLKPSPLTTHHKQTPQPRKPLSVSILPPPTHTPHKPHRMPRAFTYSVPSDTTRPLFPGRHPPLSTCPHPRSCPFPHVSLPNPSSRGKRKEKEDRKSLIFSVSRPRHLRAGLGPLCQRSYTARRVCQTQATSPQGLENLRGRPILCGVPSPLLFIRHNFGALFLLVVPSCVCSAPCFFQRFKVTAVAVPRLDRCPGETESSHHACTCRKNVLCCGCMHGSSPVPSALQTAPSGLDGGYISWTS